MTTFTTSQTGEPTPALPVTDTWLVIPPYNEATVVHEVISQAHTVFLRVVVVDDGSKDASAREVATAGAVVMRYPINLGQGAALQTGFSYMLGKTNADYIVTFDVDGQYSATDAAAMVAAARAESLAVILGSHFLEGLLLVGWLKRIVLRTVAAVGLHISGMRLTDAHNGLRVLHHDALAQLDLRQNRMAHASKIIRQTDATGMPWREFPVHIAYIDYSRVKGWSLWNSVSILVDLLFS